jgi:hypothetical protein
VAPEAAVNRVAIIQVSMVSKFFYKYYPLLVALALFLLLIPLTLKVDFMQNDDWYYYEAVENFKNLDFTLHEDIAPTFYLQGVLGAVFTLVFPLARLPVLTLIFSVANFYILYLILFKYFKVFRPVSLLLSLMFFVNPLHGYSVWGFMTENYFLTFVLTGLYFFFDSQKEGGNQGKIFPANLTFLLAFFARQLALVFYIASAIYFLAKGQTKKFITQLAWFVGLFTYYETLFPKTLEMSSKALQFHHLLEVDYVFAVIYGSLIYLVAFTLPLTLYFLIKFIWTNKKNYLKVALFFVFSILVYKGVSNYYNPELVSWGEFPYFENSFERTGFYPRSLHGTMYQFRGIYDLYYYWDLTARVLLAGLIGFALVEIKKLFKGEAVFLSSFLIIYLGVGALAVTFFDRYLVAIVPVFMLFLFKVFNGYKMGSGKLSVSFLAVLTAGFLVVASFIFYTFSYDFILRESYVWNRSKSLVEVLGASSGQTLSSSAWNEKYMKSSTITYLFSYDTFEVNEELKEGFNLVEKFEINYPLNIHINPAVYLYKAK